MLSSEVAAALKEYVREHGPLTFDKLCDHFAADHYDLATTLSWRDFREMIRMALGWAEDRALMVGPKNAHGCWT